MSRNTFIITILAVVLIGAAGIGGYLYFFTDLLGGISTGGVSGSIKSFLPFGDTKSGGRAGGSSSSLDGSLASSDNAPAARLLKLSQAPISGFVPFLLGSTTMIRYAERETGRVFEIDMSLPSVRTKITSTTIPKTRQAIFGDKGSSVIFRYLDDYGAIQTYYAGIPIATSTEDFKSGVSLKGKFLSDDIEELSVSPSLAKIFTLSDFGSSAVGTISDLDGGRKSQIFDSPFTEWLSSWANDATILLTTKPSSSAGGFAYSLDAKSGKMEKIYGGTAGLTALLSPDGKKLLVSESDNGKPSLKIFRVSDKSLVTTGLQTIADKCLWSSSVVVYCGVPGTVPGGNFDYPDSWYQGIVSFSDSIWSVDTETSGTDMILPVSQTARESIDAVNLSTDKALDYLFFINKNDGSLWSLKLR